MSFRDIKRKMRRDLHRVLQVEAVYVPLDKCISPFQVTMRLHYKMDVQGDLKGTNYHYAEKQDIEPYIIVFKSDVSAPKRGDIFSVEPGEAWRVDNAEKPDDETLKVMVTRVSANETILATLPQVGDV